MPKDIPVASFERNECLNHAQLHELKMLRAQGKFYFKGEEKEAEPKTGGDSTRCQGETQSGKRCKKPAVEGTNYCAVHTDAEG